MKGTGTESAKYCPICPTHLILYRNKGCERCGYTGYRGRQAIFEVLPVNEAIKSAIVAGKDAGSIAHTAFELGYRPLCPPRVPKSGRRDNEPFRGPEGNKPVG